MHFIQNAQNAAQAIFRGKSILMIANEKIFTYIYSVEMCA